MVAISGIGLLLIGMNHYFDLWPQNHITLDLLISIIFVATQTLVMFFFVGTGVNIREYVESHSDVKNDLYQQMLGLKRKLYPPTMMVTILFMALVIIDGIFSMETINVSPTPLNMVTAPLPVRSVSEWWFHILYILTVYYYIKATNIQHQSFKESTEIVLTMTKTERTDY
jgi:hypothetical protein